MPDLQPLQSNTAINCLLGTSNLPSMPNIPFALLTSFFLMPDSRLFSLSPLCVLVDDIIHGLFSCKLLSSRMLNGKTYWVSTIIVCFSWMITGNQRVLLFLHICSKWYCLCCLQPFVGCSGVVSDYLRCLNPFFYREYVRLIDWLCSGIIIDIG
jgi:hypothetical protein